MQVKLVILSFVFILVNEATSLKLPSYIKPCSRNDPNLNQCALKNGRLAVSRLLEGDRKYKVPVLNPFTISELRVNQGLGLKFTWTNAQIVGLAKANVQKVDMDLKKHTMDIEFTVPQAMILSKYNVTGRILVLPITGKGNCNITLDNLKVRYTLKYDLIKKGSKGEVYINPKEGDIKWDITKAYMKFENLFNGDKVLGKQMHIFLNENWKEVTKEVGPSIAEAIGQVIFQILSNICDLVPYDNVFPEKV